jgi:hypothetical protein
MDGRAFFQSHSSSSATTGKSGAGALAHFGAADRPGVSSGDDPDIHLGAIGVSAAARQGRQVGARRAHGSRRADDEGSLKVSSCW